MGFHAKKSQLYSEDPTESGVQLGKSPLPFDLFPPDLL